MPENGITMKRGLMSIVLWIALALSTAANESWLDEKSMTKAFAGQTLTGKYATGLPFTETYAGDGSINYWDPTQQSTGRWQVTKQGFCTFYDSMNGGCFVARSIGANCFEFYIVESQDDGPLTPEEGKPYVAQGWYPDKPSTCVALTT
jgi:hypothetical protein